MSPIPEKSLERRSAEIFKHWNRSLSRQDEAVTYITTQQSAVRVSRRGKQNITRYVKDSAMLTIISQSEKIGKRWLHRCFFVFVFLKKDTDLSFFSPFLFFFLNSRKNKTKNIEALSGNLFGSALWWVEKKNPPPTSARIKLGATLYIMEIKCFFRNLLCVFSSYLQQSHGNRKCVSVVCLKTAITTVISSRLFRKL